jgi:hypothetical protein
MVKIKVTRLQTSQTEFLHDYLRGTGKTLSERQAREFYGIQNLRARMSELRRAGLVVRQIENEFGETAYAISARDVNGSRARAELA